MQRKYIYIIVTILAIIISVSDYYVEQSLNVPNVNELETANNLEPHIFDDTEFPDIFDSAAMKSPIIIRNLQNDDDKITYTYNLKIDGVYGAHKYQKNNKTGYIVFSANGETTFELDSNETLTIFDIPNEVEYTIEQVTKNSQKYITKINDVETYSATGTVFIETYIDIENNTIPNKTPVEKPPVETKPEEKPKPSKPTSPEKNPITSDGVYLAIALFLATGLLLLSLFKLKVKRFE